MAFEATDESVNQQHVWSCPCLNVRMYGKACLDKHTSSQLQILLDQDHGVSMVRSCIEYSEPILPVPKSLPQLVSRASITSKGSLLKHPDSNVCIQCNLCHEPVYTMHESTTPPAFKHQNTIQLGQSVSRFVPMDGMITLTQACLSEEVIRAKEREASYSQIYGVILPPPADDESNPSMMAIPHLKDPNDVSSFFSMISRASFDNPSLSVTSDASAESLDEHAWHLLEQYRASLVSEMAAIIRNKQEEWLEHVQKARSQLLLLAQHIGPSKPAVSTGSSTPQSDVEHPKSELFAKRFMEETLVPPQRSTGTLGASLARYSEAHTGAKSESPVEHAPSPSPPYVNQSGARLMDGGNSSDHSVAVNAASTAAAAAAAAAISSSAAVLESSAVSPLSLSMSRGLKDAAPQEDMGEQDDGSGKEDQMFQTDEDMTAARPVSQTGRGEHEPFARHVPDRKVTDEKVAELLSSGLATSFSAISVAQQAVNFPHSRLEQLGLKGAYDVPDNHHVRRLPPVPRKKRSFLQNMHDHDEDLALAGAVAAHAPSHRHNNAAVASNDAGHHPPTSKRATEPDTQLSLATSVPYHPLIPVRNLRRREMTEGIDHEPKTSLPCNENRMVPSLLQALREKNSMSPVTKRTTGFQLPSARPIPLTPKPRSVFHVTVNDELPPIPQAPSRHLRLDPSSGGSPRALNNVNLEAMKDSEVFDESMNKALYFMHYLQNLKLAKRTGWYHHNVPEPESISDHMYRMGVLAMLIKDDKIDIRKSVMMALVHDISEALVGDLTPHCQVDKDEKSRREHEAIHILTHDLLGDTDASHTIFQLWREYEERQTREAVLVKDLDCFELCLQAFEYEKLHDIQDLQQFWLGAAHKIKHPQVQAWLAALLRKRRVLWESRGFSYDNATQ